MNVEIVAAGRSLPSDRVSNEEFWSRAQFTLKAESEEHAREKLLRETRMESRYWCGPDENTWTMARAAIDNTLRANPELADEIDLVLVASASTLAGYSPPESSATGMADLAPLVVNHLGRNVLGMDIKACACTGFLRALQVADAMLATKQHTTALVVATEQTSRFAVAQSNRSGFCSILADAAGAVVLRQTTASVGSPKGLVDHVGYTDGAKRSWMMFGDDLESLVVRGSQLGPTTIELLTDCAAKLLDRNYLSVADVDWLLPVQTHAGLIDEVCEKLLWPQDKLLWYGDKVGFSGSASIPSALAGAIADGTVRKGDLLLAVAVGAGLNCAGSLFYY